MNTNIKQNIIIIASNTTWTPGNIDVDAKNAPNIQDELMGVMIKSIFNDTLNKP